MPGFDRTGPNGQGPMTGRGMGNCQAAGSGHMPRGRRGGCGFGNSWGRGRRQGFYRNAPVGMPVEMSVDTDDNQRYELQNQIDDLKTQLIEIKKLLLSKKTEAKSESSDK